MTGHHSKRGQVLQRSEVKAMLIAIKLVDKLEFPKGQPTGTFNYATGKNEDKLSSEAKGLEKAEKFLVEKQKEMEVIGKKHGTKDSKGEIIITEDGKITIPNENIKEFNKEMEAINEKYKTQQEELDKILDGEADAEIKLHMIKPSDLPDGYPKWATKALFPMIEEK